MAVVNGLQSLQTGTQLENLINKCELPVSFSGSFIRFHFGAECFESVQKLSVRLRQRKTGAPILSLNLCVGGYCNIVQRKEAIVAIRYEKEDITVAHRH